MGFVLKPDGYPGPFRTTDRGDGFVVTGVIRTVTALRAGRFRAEHNFFSNHERLWSSAAGAAFVAENVMDWDLRSPDGEPRPVTADAVLSLPAVVQDELADLVFGYGPGEAPWVRASPVREN